MNKKNTPNCSSNIYWYNSIIFIVLKDNKYALLNPRRKKNISIVSPFLKQGSRCILHTVKGIFYIWKQVWCSNIIWYRYNEHAMYAWYLILYCLTTVQIRHRVIQVKTDQFVCEQINFSIFWNSIFFKDTQFV